MLLDKRHLLRQEENNQMIQHFFEYVQQNWVLKFDKEMQNVINSKSVIVVSDVYLSF